MNSGEREPSISKILTDMRRTMETYVAEGRAEREEARAFREEARAERELDRKRAAKDSEQAAEDRRQATEDRMQAVEDRRQAVEDRRQWQLRWEEDRRQAAVDRQLYAEVVLRLSHILEGLQEEAREARKDRIEMRALMLRQIRLLETNNLLLRRLVSNGRFGGNGSRSRRQRGRH